jgi:hypothetical protein
MTFLPPNQLKNIGGQKLIEFLERKFKSTEIRFHQILSYGSTLAYKKLNRLFHKKAMDIYT